ncbi:MAG: hypothetical protein L6R43_04605 [Planctomycetes bacterium]|nr:hypothetical protein [Planctomycetota bacterium]
MEEDTSPPTTADEERRFQRYIEVSRIYFQHFDTRRAYEWKITLGLWATILLITKGIMDNRDWPGAKAVAAFLPYCYLAVLVVYGWIWSLHMYKANRYDKDRANYYLDRARDLTPPIPEDSDVEAAYRGPRKGPTATDLLMAWTHLFQFLVTLFLMLGSWWVSVIVVG